MSFSGNLVSHVKNLCKKIFSEKKKYIFYFFNIDRFEICNKKICNFYGDFDQKIEQSEG